MIRSHSIAAGANSMFGKTLIIVFAAILITSVAAPQNKPQQACAGLHAAIKGELVRYKPPYTQPPFVQLSFILLNDSEGPINVEAASWKIVVDGKDLEDSGMIFGNGPAPTDGFRTLKPGESYVFGKGLEIGRYFPEQRAYQVLWKGEGFRSSTITVTVTGQQ